MKKFLLVLVLLALTAPAFGQSCGDLNFSSDPQYYKYNICGYEEHSPGWGDHSA